MERTKKGLLLAKLETTYGVDAAPVATANVIAVRRGEVTYNPEFDDEDRDILDGGISRVVGDNVLPRVSLAFTTEIRGNRTNGAAPDISAGSASYALEIDALLQACDLNPTYTAESSGGARDGYVSYKPTVPTDEGKSVTLWFYTEKKIHKIVGAKGSVSANLKAGRYGVLNWNFQGLYVAPVDGSIPGTITWLDTKPPLFVNSGTTLDAWSGAVFDELTFDLGNDIQRRDDAQATSGVRGFMIADRNSRGTMNPESVAEATHPVWADLAAGKLKTLIGKIGSQSGNRLDATLTLKQTKVAYEDKSGNRIAKLDFSVRRSGLSTALGNELLLKFY